MSYFIQDEQIKTYFKSLNIVVSTVAIDTGASKTIETMIFATDPDNDENWDTGHELYCETYKDWNEAQIGHFTICGQIVSGREIKELGT
jgi:hypothetical protein